MGLDVLKIILLRGIRDDFLDMLNLLGKGDISKESFEKIVELCTRYSRGSSSLDISVVVSMNPCSLFLAFMAAEFHSCTLNS